jgi:hypothetical protein
VSCAGAVARSNYDIVTLHETATWIQRNNPATRRLVPEGIESNKKDGGSVEHRIEEKRLSLIAKANFFELHIMTKNSLLGPARMQIQI